MTAENSGRAAPGRPFQKGQSGNPGGRPVKTDDERAGELYLRERTQAAAERLVQLQQSDDEKIALGATVAHLKITLGTLERQGDAAGNSVNPFSGLTHEELVAIAQAQMEKAK